MDILSLCRLPVGIVRWYSSAPSLTVVVKATFSLEQDGYAPLAVQQEPLTLDHPRAARAGVSPNELFVSTDFAPFKPKADVLLSGRARVSAPARVIPVRFGVDTIDKHFFAFAGEPAIAIPLTDAYLRSDTSPTARSVMVGARAPWSPERAALAGAQAARPESLHFVPLPRNFDYRFFNAAPPDQQLATPPTTALITLQGLLAGAPMRRAKLPGNHPRVFSLPRALDPRSATPHEVELRCDTLWIDADRALCTLTWRGVIPLPAELLQLVVVVEPHGVTRTWSSIREQLGSAMQLRAVEPTDLLEVPHAAPVKGSAERQGGVQGARGQLDPLQVHTVPRKDDAIVDDGLMTLAPPLVSLSSQSVLPFAVKRALIPKDPAADAQTSGRALDARSVDDGSATLAPPLVTGLSRPVLPFVIKRALIPKDPAADAERDERAFDARGVDDGSATLAPPLVSPSPRPVLPFVPEEPCAQVSGGQRAQIPQRRAETGTLDAPLVTAGGRSQHETHAVLPFQRGLPPASAPLSLETYAAIKADIWAEAAAREAVLERHGLDEIAWDLAEQRQAEGMERDASEGQATAASSLLCSLRAARRRSAQVAVHRRAGI